MMITGTHRGMHHDMPLPRSSALALLALNAAAGIALLVAAVACAAAGLWPLHGCIF